MFLNLVALLDSPEGRYKVPLRPPHKSVQG